MTWAPHQERFPRSIDGNGTEKGQDENFSLIIKGWAAALISVSELS
jgi:hypothetical protein